MAQWGERQPDGSVVIYDDSSGTPREVGRESWEKNQGITAPPAKAGGDPSSGGTYNPGESELMVQAAHQRAQLAYLREKLRLIDVPMLEIEREKLAQLKAQQEVANTLANKKFEQIDLPMLKLQQDQLEETKRQFEKSFGLQQGELDLRRQTQLGDLALRGADLASREAVQRTQIGVSGLGDAERIGLQREEMAQRGLFQGEELARSADEFSLRAAGQLNDTALAAMNLQAQTRGPRNAWVQQAVMRGLNKAGLSRDVGAIAGEYDPATFQAPQAAAQAASLGTMAEDMAAAGGHAAPGTTANDMIRRLMVTRAADPYGAAGSAAIGMAGRQAADPYGRFGGQMGEAAAGQVAGQYDSPTSWVGQQMAGRNMMEGTPDAPSMRARGGGQAVYDAWGKLNERLGRRPTDREMAQVYTSVFGLPPDVADREAAADTAYFAQTGMPRPPTAIEQSVVRAIGQLGPQNMPGRAGTGERIDRAWWNLRRSQPVGSQAPAWNDPRTLRIWRDVGGMDPMDAPDAAWNAANWYGVTGAPMGSGPLGENARDPRRGRPMDWADPTGGDAANFRAPALGGRRRAFAGAF